MIKTLTLDRIKRNFLLHQLEKKHQANEQGFTLLELAVIVVIIGVLSAIAAPAWDAFVSRQRIRSVNGQVLQALQIAQAEAKRRKADRKIEFDNDGDIPVYRIYERDNNGDFNNLISETIINLNGEIAPEQVQLETPASNGTPVNEITFNYLGSVENTNTPFRVIVSPFDSTNSPRQRCVIVQTLLGAMRVAEGNDNNTGCGS